MNDGKDLLKSSTFYGAIATIISTVLVANGIAVDVATITAVIGGVVSIIGRIKASQPITTIGGVGPKPPESGS